MARKYSRSASKDVEGAMRKREKGTLKSGGSGKTVKSRKQAIAIGLSEARQKGKKVPARKSSSGRKSTSARKSSGRSTTARRSTARKSTARKSTARKSTVGKS